MMILLYASFTPFATASYNNFINKAIKTGISNIKPRISISVHNFMHSLHEMHKMNT
jgi:hypothetical protein